MDNLSSDGRRRKLIDLLKHLQIDPIEILCIMNVLFEREKQQQNLLEYLEAVKDNPPEMDDLREAISDIVDEGLPEE